MRNFGQNFPIFYLGSFYFTRNFWLSNFENRGCVTVNIPYGFPAVKMALQEPKNGYATTIFQVWLPEISGEIDTSVF